MKREVDWASIMREAHAERLQAERAAEHIKPAEVAACYKCGKKMKEEEAIIMVGRYLLCSRRCARALADG